MNIGDNIRVEPIFDYKNGRRFQILITNREPGQNFTVHHDMMAREYMKLKLSETDLMTLIEEVRKCLMLPESDPKIAEIKSRRERLKIITKEE